jgi:tripartite-type tricarboxylate transporter receptor subunit TctC
MSWLSKPGKLLLLAAGCVAVFGSTPSLPASGQSFGSQPVRIIVPYAAGGIVDLMARTVSDKLGEKLGAPVVVESRAGANTAIGTDAVARSNPDGHTLLMATSALVITPQLQKVNYDPVADFVGVGYIGYAASIATVHPSVPAADIRSFIAYAKSKPGELNYLAPGTSSSFTLSAVLLEQVNDIKMTAVSYRGVPPGMPDLMTGRLHFGFIPAPLAVELIADGKLNAIAVTGGTRLKQLPQIPTMAEQGYGTSQVTSWYAFATSAKTPKSTIDLLNAALNETLNDPAIIARVEEMGGSVASGWTSEQTTKLFAEESTRWGDVLRKSGIKAN